MFLLVSGAILVPLDWHKHGVSIQSFINLRKTFFRISRIWSIAQTWFLARLFADLSSFICQILDFLYLKVSILILMAWQWKPTKQCGSISRLIIYLGQYGSCPGPIIFSIKHISVILTNHGVMQNTEKTSWQLVFKLFLLRKRVALDDSWMTMLKLMMIL